MNKMLSNVIDKKKATKREFIDVIKFINSYSSEQLINYRHCIYNIHYILIL